MVRHRTKSLVATLAILTLVLSSVFSGAVTAESGAPAAEDAPRAVQQAAYPGDFICKNVATNQLRFSFTPSCPAGQMLIQISASLPFDYCYSQYTKIISDDLPGDVCSGFGNIYTVIDGTSSFFICVNTFTRVMYQLNSIDGCTTGLLIGIIDLRGDIMKYVCVEENLNPLQCDFFPAGPHNEIRQIGPIPNTSGGFIDCMWQWVFNGVNSPTQSCINDSSNADIELALEALPGINDVSVTGGPIAGTVDEPIRIEFVGVDAQTDIIPRSGS